MKGKISTILFWGMLGLFLCVSTTIRTLSDWFDYRFGVSFEEVLFTITSPLEGSDVSFLDEAVEYIVPKIISTIGVWIMIIPIVVLLRIVYIRINLKVGKREKKLDAYQVFKTVCILLVIASFVQSISYGFKILGLEEYIARKLDQTTIYEEYYVNPNEISITNNEQPKNLIYIYAESMETTYASVDEGGCQEINYIPRLTELAQQNVSFSDSELLGGAKLTAGSTWTMGALFSTTTGVPFSLPINGNGMDAFEEFSPGITSLGDVLEGYGYEQMFLCGSDGEFGGSQITLNNMEIIM